MKSANGVYWKACGFREKTAISLAERPWLVLAVALTGGIIGGALANHLAATAPAAAADVPARSIAAQQILLVDARGKVHASLQLDDSGEPMLRMSDLSGRDRLDVGFGREGAPGIGVTDQKGMQRALLSVADDGVPTFRLYDGEARPRMLLGVDSQGNPALDFYEHDGKLLRELP